MANTRNKVSDDVLKQMVCELLDTGERGATNFYELLRTKVQLAKGRCLKLYPIIELEWVKFKDNVVSNQRASDIAEAAKNGLKSKLEKQLNLQEEINQMDRQLSGEITFSYIVGNKIFDSHDENGNFNLPVQIQNDIRVKKLQYTSELNKMEGDYAPTKVAATNTAGEDVSPNIIIQQLSVSGIEIRENE